MDIIDYTADLWRRARRSASRLLSHGGNLVSVRITGLACGTGSPEQRAARACGFVPGHTGDFLTGNHSQIVRSALAHRRKEVGPFSTHYPVGTAVRGERNFGDSVAPDRRGRRIMDGHDVGRPQRIRALGVAGAAGHRRSVRVYESFGCEGFWWDRN
jgi:hypothetical protein